MYSLSQVNFEKVLNDCFNEVFNVESLGTSLNTYPKIDMYTTEKDSTIQAAVPGLTKDQLSVQCNDGRLVLKGEKVVRKEGKYHNKELHRSSFERSWYLNDRHDVEKIQTTLENGILTIVVPLKEVKKKVLNIEVR